MALTIKPNMAKFTIGAVFLSLFSQSILAQSAPAKPQAYPVDVTVIEKQPVQLWKEFSGRLEAVDHVEIRPQASGLITEIKFEDGQLVEKGDTLYVIDPRPLEVLVEQKKANLISAQNSYTLAKKEYIRAKDLLAKKIVSQQYYDERKNTRQVTQAAVNKAKAELSEAKINLSYAYVKAPVSGRISRAELTQGNLVSAGSNAPLLTTIVSVGKIYADFDVDEQTYINYVHKHSSGNSKSYNNPVELSLQNDDQIYRGKIHAFDNRIDPRSGTIRARAIFDNPQGRLLPGMYAHLKIGAAKPQDLILLNERAIGTDQDRKFVYVVNDDNIVTYREIKIGRSIAGSRVIESGLMPGDKVIARGLMRIRPNMPVAPKIISSSEAVSS